MTKKKDADKKMNIDGMFQRIEEKIALLEQPDISLEDSLEAYEEGMKYIRECQESITNVEQKILLLKQDGGADEL